MKKKLTDSQQAMLDRIIFAHAESGGAYNVIVDGRSRRTLQALADAGHIAGVGESLHKGKTRYTAIMLADPAETAEAPIDTAADEDGLTTVERTALEAIDRKQAAGELFTIKPRSIHQPLIEALVDKGYILVVRERCPVQPYTRPMRIKTRVTIAGHAALKTADTSDYGEYIAHGCEAVMPFKAPKNHSFVVLKDGVAVTTTATRLQADSIRAALGFRFIAITPLEAVTRLSSATVQALDSMVEEQFDRSDLEPCLHVSNARSERLLRRARCRDYDVTPLTQDLDAALLSLYQSHRYLYTAARDCVQDGTPIPSHLRPHVECGALHVQLSPNERTIKALIKHGFVEDVNEPGVAWARRRLTPLAGAVLNVNLDIGRFRQVQDVELPVENVTERTAPSYDLAEVKPFEPLTRTKIFEQASTLVTEAIETAEELVEDVQATASAETPTTEEIQVANATSRGKGAIGPGSVVLQHVLATGNTFDHILDYGAGKTAEHTKTLREQGFRVTAYEFGDNFNEAIHDAEALDRQYSTVIASNVLNVQSSRAMLCWTIEQITRAVADEGRLVCNYPAEPRKLPDYKGKDLLGDLFQWFESVQVVSGGLSRPLIVATRPIRRETTS